MSVSASEGLQTKEQTQFTQLAKTEFIHNEQGEVTDIQFSKNGENITLKSLFPGSYKIVPTHFSKKACEEDPMRYGRYLFHKDTLEYNVSSDPKEQSKANHMLLYDVALATTSRMYNELHERHITFQQITHKRHSLRDGKDYLPQEVSTLYSDIERWNISPAEKQHLRNKVKEINAVVSKVTTQEELEQYLEKQKYYFDHDYQAAVGKKLWQLTDHAMDTLKQQGIPLFTETKEEFHKMLEPQFRNKQKVQTASRARMQPPVSYY